MRSLLKQLTQIANTASYDDYVVGANLSSVAEPTVSGVLEMDLNNLRTITRQVKGTSDWYTDLGTYFDPTNTNASSTQTKTFNMSNFKNSTLDAKTVLMGIQDTNSDAGYTVASGTTGFLVTSVTPYSKPTDRRGLPIFASTTHSGSYWDEGADDRVTRIDVINMDTDSEFITASGHEVYGKFHDGSDFSGSGDGTDVYVRLYANDIPITLQNNNVTSVGIVYPVRRVMNAVAEYEWLRTSFASGWGGDWELVDDISNLWLYTGASDNLSSTTGTWAHTESYYLLQSDPSSLHSAIDVVNNGIGDRNYSQDNYITDGEAVSLSIDKLDIALKSVADTVSAGVAEKYVESVASDITVNTAHTLPSSITYTPSATSGREGMNMDVYIDGQLLAADTGTNGANADRDYGETSTTTVTFRFTVYAGQNITYAVRQ